MTFFSFHAGIPHVVSRGVSPPRRSLSEPRSSSTRSSTGVSRRRSFQPRGRCGRQGPPERGPEHPPPVGVAGLHPDPGSHAADRRAHLLLRFCRFQSLLAVWIMWIMLIKVRKLCFVLICDVFWLTAVARDSYLSLFEAPAVPPGLMGAGRPPMAGAMGGGRRPMAGRFLPQEVPQQEAFISVVDATEELKFL